MGWNAPKSLAVAESDLACDPGSKPDLVWLPVQILTVDRSYQRSLESERSQQLVNRIAADFKWFAFQAILATRPPGQDTYLILDGQHRVEAARRVGITHVPAVVVEAATVAEQAAAFVRANLDRVAVTPYALFHARIAAGDENAVLLAAVCEESSLSIPKYPIQAEQMSPGQTLALTAIKSWVSSLGDQASIRFLRTVAETWRDPPGQIRANVLLAIRDIVLATPGAQREDLRQKLKRVLASNSANTLESKARNRKERYGGTFKDNIAALIKQAIAVQGNQPAGVDPARLRAGR